MQASMHNPTHLDERLRARIRAKWPRLPEAELERAPDDVDAVAALVGRHYGRDAMETARDEIERMASNVERSVAPHGSTDSSDSSSDDVPSRRTWNPDPYGKRF